MRHHITILFFTLIAFNTISQNKKGVIKTDISGIAEYNFYQLAYEFSIKEKSSMEVGIGFSSKSGVNVFGLSIQPRYYTKEAPKGFHFGPRVLALYAETNNSNVFGAKENAFAFELDGLIGYQLLISNTITLDPYAGFGIATSNGETITSLILGITLGVAF